MTRTSLLEVWVRECMSKLRYFIEGADVNGLGTGVGKTEWGISKLYFATNFTTNL